MKMLPSAALVVVLGALALPAAGSASVAEIGQFDANQRGSCPSTPCAVLSHTTGYQAKVGDSRGLMAAPADGRIVAFTVGLGKPGPTQTTYFTNKQKLGATPSVQLTILDPQPKLRARVVASSSAIDPTPYFGSTAQFPLSRSLPIKKGQLIGITSTTWAPILTLSQPSTSSWRASRQKGNCDDVVKQTAQTQTNATSQYYCLYRSVRLAYSATFIPDPAKTATPKKQR